MKEPKILLLDLETSLELVAVFGLRDNDWIDPSNLITERYIICASYKWLGEKKVHHVSVLDDPKRFKRNPSDDLYVVKVLRDIVAQADVLVGHNLGAFDKPYLETRILYHGIDPLPPIATIDTYKTAKSRFRFNSNKLTYLGEFLKVGGKKETSHGLWMKVLKGDIKAIKEMIDYNVRDVELLEDVFNKLKPYMPNFINRELFGDTGCPRCGSKKVQSRGVHRAISRIYQRFQCTSCAGWFRKLKAEPGGTSTRVI